MGRSYELKMADDGNILMYVEGGYNGYPWGVDPIVQKLTPDGDSLWTYSPPGINSQQCYDMSTLTNGDIVFTGTPSEFEWLRCISPDGKYKWHRKFKPPDSRPNDRLQLTRILGTSDGGMLIAGYYDKYPDTWEEHLDADVIVIKLDSMGCLTPGCGVEEIFVSTKEAVDEPVTEGFMIQPNPASDEVSLLYPGWQAGTRAEAQIFDMTGKSLMVVALSSPLTLLNVQHLPTSMYLVRLTLNSEPLFVQKLVKY